MSGQMTKEAASRIQSSQAEGGGDVGKGSFASRAQSAADKHVNAAANNSASKGNAPQK